MLISVVIPTCDRPEDVERDLARLSPGGQEGIAHVSAPSGDCAYDVTVTEDGPRALSRDLVRTKFPWARWVAGPRRGPAANRNAAARATRGEWLVFLDDDCLPVTGWMRSFADAMRRPGCSPLLQGGVVADRERRRADEEAPLCNSAQWLRSGNLAARRDDFDRLGGFCEQFRLAAMEDVEFQRRAEKNGYRLEYVPGATVSHPWRIVEWKRLRWQRRSLLTYFALHPETLPRGLSLWRTALSAPSRSLLHVVRHGVEMRGVGALRALQIPAAEALLWAGLLCRSRLGARRDFLTGPVDGAV